MSRLVLLFFVPVLAAAAPPVASNGRELFLRNWEPYDPRAQAGGDGLGPMYNATSCATCHGQGGTGGGGTTAHNIRLVLRAPEVGFLVEHRASTLTNSPNPATRVARVAPGPIQMVERNPPALFGAGVIDAIPELAILANMRFEGAVTGRPSRTAEGHIGRFGWKGHTASLADFVATACANELGLAVPGHPQGAPPPGEASDRQMLVRRAEAALGGASQGVDLADDEVAALTRFVATLPQPRVLYDQPARIRGEMAFAEVGCDDCHVRDLATAAGIYSDLLLHDLGQRLADGAASYRTRGVGSPAVASLLPDEESREDLATAGEWRTPPLWGVRDSAPYLHDGRAPTLDDAILAHDGEASGAVARYRALAITERQDLQSFLSALVAPQP